MCAALMDGRAWTVGELGSYAGLARSTASEHVDVLIAGDIVTEVRQGRHRYITLADEEIARVIESPGIVARSTLATPHSLSAWKTNENIREGRTCYRHLAGRLGVAITERLHDREFLDPSWQPTCRGRRLFTDWGIPDTALETATSCLDSTERRFHLAGPLGTGICTALFANNWIARIGPTRAVRLTHAGQAALACEGLALTAVESSYGNRHVLAPASSS